MAVKNNVSSIITLYPTFLNAIPMPEAKGKNGLLKNPPTNIIVILLKSMSGSFASSFIW